MAANNEREETASCNVVPVGRRRDGGTRYWCLLHRADATAKYGRPGNRCRYAHVPPVRPSEICKLDIDGYSGGIGIWGAVPPIYDTTELPLEHGIHVHARPDHDGSKEIDRTFRSVRLISSRGRLPKDGVVLSELDAIYWMVSSVFGYATKHVVCTLCGHPHLDKDWFSVHPHRRHLCAGCGRQFTDNEISVGNPISRVRELLPPPPKATKKAKKKLHLKQADFPGGIQIWGSNPAIVWTSKKQEEEGIHIHALSGQGPDHDEDDTFSEVSIDGVRLDATMVRTLMAQTGLPHLAGRVTSLKCAKAQISWREPR